jgi:hypothetical protein
MDKLTLDLITLLVPQIPFALLVFVVMERQQNRHERSCKEMLAIVDKQNELYQKISDSLDTIKTHLYIIDGPQTGRKQLAKGE